MRLKTEMSMSGPIANIAITKRAISVSIIQSFDRDYFLIVGKKLFYVKNFRFSLPSPDGTI